MGDLEKVAIIGSGNWGSAIARIVGRNVRVHAAFDSEVRMYVYEEIIDGSSKLTDIINQRHENVKYLPGYRLPTNVVAEPDLLKSIENATILVFVVPHQFLKGICSQISGKLHPRARGVSLIKGMYYDEEKGMSLISSYLSRELNIDMSVLMGANIADEVAAEQFCETTIGYKNADNGRVLHELFNTHYFRVSMIQDVAGVEVCGTLKNVVALAAGFVDGLGMGNNTKAAIMRIGLMEIRKFTQLMFGDSYNSQTVFESCGVADLITTCYGGRNRRCAEEYVRSRKPFEVIETELLKGQKLQGLGTAKEFYDTMLSHNIDLKEFPLLIQVYKICFKNYPPESILDI